MLRRHGKSTHKFTKLISIVNQNGASTMLVDPNTGDERPFTFDYSFWSHDGFRIDDNGINVPTSPKYADQNVVYEALGRQVLDNAWEGYNCCLFAYGQTGAGKSYSMVSKLNNFVFRPEIHYCPFHFAFIICNNSWA